jgi:NADH-quinone oxidoreductase subunit L
LRSTFWAVGAALLGVIVALWAYAWQLGALWRWAQTFPWLYRWVTGKYFVDELYAALITRPGRRFSEWVSVHFDLGIIDALVNGVGWLTARVGERVRQAQTGFVRNYALYFVTASLLVLLYLLVQGTRR